MQHAGRPDRDDDRRSLVPQPAQGTGIAVRRRDETPHPVAAWVVRRTPRRLRPGVELVVRTVADALDDRVVGLSAEIAFFTILALPPLLLTVVAALGYLPGDQGQAFVEGVSAAARRVFTTDTVDDLIRPILEEVVTGERIGVLSGAFAIAVFSASRALRVVLTSVTIAYDLEEQRPSWAQRLYGLATTLGLLVIVPILLPLLLAGPDLGQELTMYAVVPAVTAVIWPYIYWLGVGVGAVLGVAGLYHLAAPWWTPFRRDLPGAVLAVGVWLATSAGLRTYAEQALIGREVFQVIAGPLVLLLWLYMLAFGVVVGAELNAELERMWPSPEQRRAPPGDRLRDRLLASPAAARLERTLPEALSGSLDRVRSGDATPTNHSSDRGTRDDTTPDPSG